MPPERERQEAVPSMWSAAYPKLQIAWDATSLGEFMKCPRRYEYAIIGGYRAKKNADTEFGGYLAKAKEFWKKARLAGIDKEEALRGTLRFILSETWVQGAEAGHCPCPDGCNGCENPTGHPWSGRYHDVWKCTGANPYRNSKGNKAKCPWAHKGNWYPGPAPDVCGSCGSPTHSERRWFSDNPAKDRYALVRAIVWWSDDQPEEGGVELLRFPDGTDAVELPWRMVLPYRIGSESYLLVGYFDHMDQLGSEVFIVDDKSTKNALGKFYWQQYAPHVQVDVYDLAGHVVFPSLPITGVRIDATQALIGGARFGAEVFYHTDSQREELLKDLGYWLELAERYAKDNYWPMNRSNCAICPFNGVCSRPPEERQALLDNPEKFQRKHWNPLEER